MSADEQKAVDEASAMVTESTREEATSTEVLLTVKEYAARFGLHVQTVYSAIRYKRMKCRVVRATDGPRGAIRIVVPARVGESPVSQRARGRRGIYFLRCKDFVKIGLAEHVEARVAGLNGALPFAVELLAVFEVDHGESLIDAERYFHERFAECRHKGEWFTANDELLLFCQSLVVSRGSIDGGILSTLKSA